MSQSTAGYKLDCDTMGPNEVIPIKRRQYFISDLDGTLLDDRGEMSPLTIKAIDRLFIEGHVMAFSTARSIASASRVTKGLVWKYPVMVYNGALTIDLSAPEDAPVVVDRRLLSVDLTHEIIRLGETYGVSPFVYMIDPAGREVVHYRESQAAGPTWFLEARRGDPRFRAASPLTVPQGLDAVLLNFMGRENALYPLYQRLKEQFDDVISVELFPDTYEEDMYYLELCHKDANKGAAALRWTELVGCRPEDVTVFGDNYNDETLFRVAGKSVAVANAQPELRQIASKVIGSNVDDGVAKYLFHMIDDDESSSDESDSSAEVS